MTFLYRLLGPALALVALASVPACDRSSATAPDPKSGAGTPKTARAPRPFARLFVQDHAAASLRWADLRGDEKGGFSLDPLATVEGFPALDPSRQKLVQMKESDGLVWRGRRSRSG